MKPIIFLALFSIMVLFFQNCSGGGETALKIDSKTPTETPSNEPQEPVKEVQEHQKVVYIDPKAQSIYQKFLDMGKNVIVTDLIIEVIDYDGAVVNTAVPGICIKEENKTPRIILQKHIWDSYGDSYLGDWDKTASLGYHFGKCFLNREDDLTMYAGMPESFMNPNWRYWQFQSGNNTYWFDSQPRLGFSEFYWGTPYFIE
ncbi:hypothetical protein [Bdellovibrio bacteriovorus]|nr:hypothetical protein [Bdellovibrio bacteriovorus]